MLKLNFQSSTVSFYFDPPYEKFEEKSPLIPTPLQLTTAKYYQKQYILRSQLLEIGAIHGDSRTNSK